jgi:hypothetical protein
MKAGRQKLLQFRDRYHGRLSNLRALSLITDNIAAGLGLCTTFRAGRI